VRLARPAPLVLAVVAALLAAGCSAGSSGSSSAAATPRSSQTAAAGPAPASPPTTLAGYYAQKLHWRPCAHRFQCARLLVPFDYQRPAWRRFSLPVIKLPASDPSRRIGSLVVNPGGPGGSGIQYALAANREISPAVRARFDVVGFDPRGVGQSMPAIHCLTGPEMDTYLATNDNPVTPGQLATVEAQSKLFVQGCEQRSGALLPYVGTRNAARDMDVLRAALGDAKLTYLGKSYGTYLGTWYAQEFPSHVRAMVLDGAVNPGQSALNMTIVQAKGFEVALRSFTANCLRLADCPLGHGTVQAGIDRLQGLLNRTASKPLISMIPGQSASAPLLLEGVVTALYLKSFWQYLRAGLAGAFAGNGSLLVELADLEVQRSSNGTYSNLVDAETAVDCVDRPWPRSLAVWRSAASAAQKAAPQFGAADMWGSLPCAYWPVPAPPAVPMHAKGAPPILVIGTTRDPATPFQQAQALARELSSGVLLAWNGDGHTAYRMGSTCIDNGVDRYLITLAPPRNGTLCQ
jgi:pimeloyl-ACP methyl ester carboxylesterase